MLRDRCSDKKMEWYMRTNITDVVLADARLKGEVELEQALDWAAQFSADEEDDWHYRLSTANTLLDFPRDRYRELLNNLEF